MKKIFFSKILPVIFVLICSVIYFNCDDSGVTTEETNTDFCINAKLSNWIPGNKTLYANIYSSSHHIYPVASCSVDNDGNFNLCFPKTLSDTALFSADSIFYSGCTGGNVTFNPPDVQGLEIYNFRVKSGGTVVGSVDCNNFVRYDSIKAGDFEVMFIYVDKDVSVNGFKLCSGDTLKFNGTAVTGWNKVIKHYTRVTPGSKTILYDNYEPPGAVWEYHGN